MESKIVSGKFQVGAVACNVECGFVPDYVRAIAAIGGAEVAFEWWKVLYDYVLAAKGKYGFVTDAAAPAHVAAATNGIIPYDTVVETVQLPAPDGDGYKKAQSIATFDATEAAYTARTITALGSVVRPTVRNGFVYEQITHVGAGAEPTWPTQLGDTVTIGGGDTWICREERVCRRGVKGFTVGATICTDGNEWVFKAELHDRYGDMGDADTENPVLFKDHDR